jgi:hypothetical protein
MCCVMLPCTIRAWALQRQVLVSIWQACESHAALISCIIFHALLRLTMEPHALLPYLVMAGADDLKLLRRLLKAGADPNLQDTEGRTVGAVMFCYMSEGEGQRNGGAEYEGAEYQAQRLNQPGGLHLKTNQEVEQTLQNGVCMCYQGRSLECKCVWTAAEVSLLQHCCSARHTFKPACTQLPLAMTCFTNCDVVPWLLACTSAAAADGGDAQQCGGGSDPAGCWGQP